jgi:hypothetical protein
LEEFKPPVDSDDEIALLHDLNYKNAKSEEDICNADRLAIGDILKTGFLILLITTVLLADFYWEESIFLKVFLELNILK